MNFNWLTLEAADTTGTQGGAAGLLMPLIMFGVMIAAMYFFIIRPQKKKEKAEKKHDEIRERFAE